MPKQKKKKKKATNRKKKVAYPTEHPLKKWKYYISMLVIILSSGLIVFSFSNKPPDDRPTRIDSYFAKHNLPLAGYGQIFVDVAETCDMDWRLLPAIAMQESTGGKFMQYNNPFGWGSAEIPFANFEEAIREVGRNLCGFSSTTAKWYSTTSTEEKLYWYNGTVNPRYPGEVMWIMEQI